MAESVRVSVVIAVDDSATHLEAAVLSALRSDLQELEVLVVDNSPTDRSATICVGEADSRLARVRLRPGRGKSRPRNVGIARARAPYVTFLESNDVLKPNWLSATATALDARSEAGFAFADFEVIDVNGRVVRRCDVFPSFDTPATEPLQDKWCVLRRLQLARGLLNGNFICTSGVVLRRKLLTEIGPFDETVAGCAELDLWFRLAHCCDALYSSDVSHSHREQPGCESTAIDAVEECIAVLRRERSRWSDRAARRQLDRLIAHKLGRIACQERQRRHRLRSAAMFAYAFATSPDLRWLTRMLGSILP